MHAKRMSRALLWGLVCLSLACSSKPAEEKTLASSTSPLVVGWEGTGAMADPRKLHAGVVLQSGKVLVTGGSLGANFLASSTIYDPGTGTWTVVAPMPQARQAHTATVLDSGKVLVAGGEGSGFLSSTAVYDPATNTWASAGTFATGAGRGYMTATELADGQVLVAGGLSNGAQGKVDVYEPATGTWAVGPVMRTARRSHAAVLLKNGKVLVVGGWNAGAMGAAEIFDPQAGSWMPTGALATARYDHTATLLPSGKVLVVGGRNGTSVVGTAELYDPDMGTWSAASAPVTAREFHSATLLSTGKVLVAGGRNGSALASAEVYDESSGQWSAAPAMASARYQHVAVLLEAQGKVLVVGGVGLATAELYEYDACAGVSCNSSPGPCYEATGTCAMGVCSYTPKALGATCDDGNACTGADACDGAGVCAGTATSCNNSPGQCYVDTGTCSGGTCSYEYKAAGEQCNDQDACTVGEVCNGAGGCAGTPVSCTSPPNTECYEATGTCGGGVCSYTPKAAGTACHDGNGGTINDVCNGAGVCAGVTACTTPPSACHDSPGTYANGACTYPLKAAGSSCAAGQICDATGQCVSKCWIGGALHEEGTSRPGVACEECNPSLSTSSWSLMPNGTSCGTSTGAWGSCGSFDDSCDTTGTQSRTVTASTCGAGTCSASSTSTETQACTRAAPNTSCAAPSYGAWSACSFSDTCAQTGTQTRTVTSYAYSCASGQCEATTSTETQACTRNTNGTSCGTPSYGNWGSCGGYSDTCDETGSQSRSATTYTCSNGTCGSATSTETQACVRTTGGTSCGTSYGSWSSCGGFSDYCDTTGRRTRTVTASTCGAGTCSATSNSTETQACTRGAPNTDCGAPSYGAWSACSFGDTCAQTGTRSRTVTSRDYNCATGQCENDTWTQEEACTRSTEGKICGGPAYTAWSECWSMGDFCSSQGEQYRGAIYDTCGGGTCGGSYSQLETRSCPRTPVSCSSIPSYGGWSACSGGDACGVGATRSRTVTSYSPNCSTGNCDASSTVEEQSCSPGSTYPWAVCNGVCTTIDDDPRNCGGCGIRCPFKFPDCYQGVCQ
jgi:hypothetical protein